jgi:hypothetical protein
MCCFFIVLLALFIWTVMMIVDVANRVESQEKTTWLVVLLVGLILGLFPVTTPLYYFLVKKKSDPSK